MRLRRYVPMLIGLLALAMVIAPTPQAVRSVAGVVFVLLIPGYALGRALVGEKGPTGEMSMLSIAGSLSVAGLGGLLLALFHTFGRAQIVGLDGLVAVVAGVTAIRRGNRLKTDRQHVSPVAARVWAAAVAATVASALILVFAFGQDVASARAQQPLSSVALAAVWDRASLKIEVIAGGTAPFSGSVTLQASSVKLATFTLRKVSPGTEWSTLVAFVRTGSVRVVLFQGRSEIRVINITPIANPKGSNS